jgi:nuclease-like protein
MLIKGRDNHDSDIESLRSLLDCQISAKQRDLIEREIKCISSGARGEDGSAYYIDFRYRDNANWAIIHDLRLEHRGFVAQIDHLLINRLFHVYVLESKNYHYGIKISSEGEFQFSNGKKYVSIESPIEQNKRHIDLLERVVKLPGFLPTRLGVSIYPSFYSYIMVAPNSCVERPTNGKFDTNMVIKADTLGTAIEKRVDGVSPMEVFSSLTMLVSQDTLEAFARRLVRLHRPSKIDYAAKFGVNAVDTPARVHEPTVRGTTDSGNGGDSKKGSTCETCGAVVDGKVVYYCRVNREKFGGKVLCRSCQQTSVIFPMVQPKSIKLSESAISPGGSVTQKGACEKCGVAVDGKVVFFCRVNKAKFEGKILCRDCQKAQ